MTRLVSVLPPFSISTTTNADLIEYVTGPAFDEEYIEQSETALSDPPLVAVVPARGGSGRVKRKNLLPVDGRPLFVLAAQTCQRALGDRGDVWVCTEDDEIAAVAEAHGLSVLPRPDEQAQVTIDEHSVWLRWQFPGMGIVIHQPDVVGVTESDIDRLIAWDADHRLSRTLVEPEEHRTWVPPGTTSTSALHPPDAVYSRRELGVRYYPPGMSGIPEVPVPALDPAAVDINRWQDVAAARYRPQPQRSVHFDVIAGEAVGLGHVYRAIAIAEEMQRWHVTFTVSGETGRGVAHNLISSRGWEVVDRDRAISSNSGRRDVWVSDILDTEDVEIAEVLSYGWQVLSMEDLGSGARLAGLVVNEMYPHPDPAVRQVTGSRWAVLRPEFIGLDPPIVGSRHGGDRPRVLVSFGGTDPARLTERIGSGIGQRVRILPTDITIVSPPGRETASFNFVARPRSMAKLMLSHDIIICSAGRTVTEAAACGLPAVVLAQNSREATHTHLGPEYGNVYLGLGAFTPTEAVASVVDSLFGDPALRGDLAWRALRSVDGLGLRRIVRRIEDLMEGL